MNRYTSARVLWWVPVVLFITFLFLFGWGARAEEPVVLLQEYQKLKVQWQQRAELSKSKKTALWKKMEAARVVYLKSVNDAREAKGLEPRPVPPVQPYKD